MDTIIKLVVTAALYFVILAFISVVAAIPTYFLWNWLMPELFGITSIRFVEAIGINFLCGILFKSHTTAKDKD